MILKLQRKFILISVAVLSAALLLLAIVVNTVNRAYVRAEIAETAEEIATTRFGFQHGKQKNHRERHGESLYESRYFIVSAGGDDMMMDMSNVASYSEDDARNMYETANASTAQSGLIGDCYYLKYSNEAGNMILFLDCSSKLYACRQLIKISIIACVVGILLSALLMSLLSRRAVQPILRNSEKQKRFITDASHELKTPLSVISANMELLAMDDPENEWIRSTRRQVGTMSRMVRDLVFLARSDEGIDRQMRGDFDLAQLLRDTADPFVLMGEAGERNFTVEAPDSMKARGDSKGIERLISVLCDNAMKYSPEKDNLSIRLTRKGAYATIETENTPATPIDDEKLAHLFDRFYRADESRSKKGDNTGFGIGLAIALAVAEAHDGTAKAYRYNDRIRIVCRLKIA